MHEVMKKFPGTKWADLAAFQRLYDDKLGALPGVLRLNSTLVMKQIVQDRPLPA